MNIKYFLIFLVFFSSAAYSQIMEFECVDTADRNYQFAKGSVDFKKGIFEVQYKAEMSNGKRDVGWLRKTGVFEGKVYDPKETFYQLKRFQKSGVGLELSINLEEKNPSRGEIRLTQVKKAPKNKISTETFLSTFKDSEICSFVVK